MNDRVCLQPIKSTTYLLIKPALPLMDRRIDKEDEVRLDGKTISDHLIVWKRRPNC